MTRALTAFGMLGLLAWAASGCSSSTGPTGPAFSDYHYSVVGSKRYYQEMRLIDTFVIDTIIDDTLPVPDTLVDTFLVVDTLVDTLLDSLWRVYTDADGVFWAQSVVSFASSALHSRQEALGASPELAVTRRVGLLADTIFLDPSIRQKVLEGPLEAGHTWLVESDGSITARLVGEETVDLGIGPTAAWHVNMGAVADEWWAPGLGRVQYEEFDADFVRVRGVLIAVGSL
jgi:hypothetical protein